MAQLPPNRQLKTIEQIFGDVKIGGTPSREKKEFFGGGLPWVSIRDMGIQREIFETSETLSEKGAQNSNVKLIPKGSLLFSFKLTVGRMCFAGVDLYTNEAIAAFEPNKEIDLNYLYYLLPRVSQQVDRTNNYGAPLLNKSVIKSLLIPLPPLTTQLAIVDQLDKASAQITANKSAIQSQLDALDQLWQSALSEVFGKKENNFNFGDKDIIDIVDGDRGSHYPKKAEFMTSGYCLFLNTSNVRQGNRNLEKLEFINQERDELLRKGKTRTGDVILTTRGTIGNCAYIGKNFEYKHVRINSGMVILRTNQEKLLPEYLLKLLLSPVFINQVNEKTSGSAQPQLPINIMKSIKLPLPDLATQTSIVSHLDEVHQHINDLKANYHAQLEAYDGLWASILDQAFKGELVSE